MSYKKKFCIISKPLKCHRQWKKRQSNWSYYERNTYKTLKFSNTFSMEKSFNLKLKPDKFHAQMHHQLCTKIIINIKMDFILLVLLFQVLGRAIDTSIILVCVNYQCSINSQTWVYNASSHSAWTLLTVCIEISKQTYFYYSGNHVHVTLVSFALQFITHAFRFLGFLSKKVS